MKLTAFRAGFYAGSRIRVGQTFEFDEDEEVQVRDKDGRPVFKDGRPVMVKVKPPKWAAGSEEARTQIAKDEARLLSASGDTKPKAARAAVKAKADALAGMGSDLA